VVLRTLTEDERSARASALADAKVRDIEERRLAEEEARRRSSREGIEQAEREAAEARRKAVPASSISLATSTGSILRRPASLVRTDGRTMARMTTAPSALTGCRKTRSRF
jgi:hypothetical protein